jgi:ABC-type transporter Mla MlaB component
MWVLLLFKAVTAYGENNLKASSIIGDRYRLTLTENLPNCGKSDPLMLNIQQSSIYLNASLLLANTNADTGNQLSLTGNLQNQQLNLSGKIDRDILCNLHNSRKNRQKPVIVQMQLQNQAQITGQLRVNGIPQKAQDQTQKLQSH